ncbi:hypothetical protein OHV05_32305 [Kitasatospora sp. NBC_00070]|uniref:hypothetical protein n=1 Tax=Kitasatospora sp. NBC_00070 TaxID=2975962 RepID=UPI00324CA928
MPVSFHSFRPTGGDPAARTRRADVQLRWGEPPVALGERPARLRALTPTGGTG